MHPHFPFALLVIYLTTSSSKAVSEDNQSSPSSFLSKPGEVSSRFSRLLHANAGSLQFSSISNVAPLLPGLVSKESKEKEKDTKAKQKKASLSAISPTNLGRRTLDYDDSDSFDDAGEPLSRSDYVYIREGEMQTSATASVSSVSKMPPNNNRIPLTLMRESDGKTISLGNPVFPDESESVGVQPPPFFRDMLNRKADIVKEEEEEQSETTTTVPQAFDEEESMVVNVVTSPPRMEVEGNPNYTTTGSSTVATTTAVVSTTTVSPPKAEPLKSNPEDLKENLVVESTRRIGSFPDFDDSPTKLEASATNSQPARVNVRPASSGKEYEYEYIYYYYDDDEENNGTGRGNASAAGKEVADNLVLPTKSTVVTAVSSAPVDFEDEEEEEVAPTPKASSTTTTPRITARTTTTRPTTTTRTTTTTTTTTTPSPVRISPIDKFFKGGVVNDNQIPRDPKSFTTSEKVSSPAVDYKIEAGDFDTEYEYEDEDEEEEEAQDKAKGQPIHTPSEEEVDRPVSQTSSVQENTSNVNAPVVLKQSNLLQSVPASRLQPQQEEAPSTTTTTTTEATTTSTPRPSRFRGSQRVRGDSVQQETSSTTESPPRIRTSVTRGRTQTQSRRPVPVETPAPENIETASKTSVSSNVRSRFPARPSTTSTTTTTTAPLTTITTLTTQDVHPNDEAVPPKTPSEDYIRDKAAHDLITFTRLQQAISSRAPSRKDIVLGPVYQKQTVVVSSSSSNEQSTDGFITFEATTVPVTPEEHPITTPTPTTTTTTTPAPSTSRSNVLVGKQRNRFGVGRGRGSTPAPDLSTASESSSASTTEGPKRTPTRGRFNRRRPAGENASDGVSTTPASESEKPRIPTRHRFSARTRPTTEASASTATEEKKQETSDVPSATSSAPTTRRRISFQNRRRPNADTGTQETDPVIPSPSTSIQESSAPEAQPERKRPVLAAGARRRPQGIGGGQRRRIGPTTTTTEKIVEAAEQSVSEDSPPTQDTQEPVESPAVPSVTSTTAETQAPPRGVLGRVRTKPRLVATTAAPTVAPSVELRKPSRLNGILNRRKPGTLATQPPAVPASEVEATPADDSTPEQHKGVVVQVSSSVTESEEVQKEGEGAADVVPVTTPASILNRLKSQRKPGSIFRKRPDPHGEK